MSAMGMLQQLGGGGLASKTFWSDNHPVERREMPRLWFWFWVLIVAVAFWFWPGWTQRVKLIPSPANPPASSPTK
jgi:hypothetical protein